MSGNYNRKKIALAGALMFMVTSVSAQTVKGVVTDNTGEPIIGASVMEVGVAGNGGVTDLDGNFTVSLKGKSKKLKVSYIGMKAKEVSVAGKETIDIKLEDDNTTLNDVVVIGYGTVRKKDLTGSVSSISDKQIANIPVSNVSEAMTGKMAGVNITTSEGSPDADVKIRVRGGGSLSQDNSPLYIVDGFPVSSISDIAPSEIQSIDVLKDASSTAIYGARGANGVIIVTTKSGSEGKTQVNFNASFGLKKVTKLIKTLDPYNFAYALFENGATNYGDYDDLDIWKSVQGTDYQDEVFGRTGNQKQYNVSVSGGTKDIKYNVGFSHNDEKSIMLGSGYAKNNVNAKINANLNKWLTLDFNARMAYTKLDGLNGGADTNESNAANSTVANTVKFWPVYPLTDADEDEENSTSVERNPVERITDTYKYQERFQQNYNVGLNWKPFKGLTFRSEFGYGWKYNNTDQVWGSNATTNSKYGFNGQPQSQFIRLQNKNWRNANTVTYDNTKLFNNHHLNVLLGQEWSSSQDISRTSTSVAYPTSMTIQEVLANTAAGTPLNNESDIKAEENILSFFGRVNYTIADKYLATFTMRADGSSKFGKNHRWGLFPSLALAWRVSDEAFMKSTSSWLSNLKARLSFGTAGNNRINSGLLSTTYSMASNTAKPPFWAENRADMLEHGSYLYNPDLKWETTVTRNFGIDYGFFNGRINGTLDFYWNTTKDLLMRTTIPSNTGYSYQFQNFGKTENKGVELALNAVIVDKKNFGLNFNFNVGINKNKVDKLAGGQTYQTYHSGAFSTDMRGYDDYRVVVGQPLGLVYGFICDGFYTVDDFKTTTDENGKTQFVFDKSGNYILKDGVVDGTFITAGSKAGLRPGAMKVRDLTGDNKISEDDRTIIGKTQPKFQGGFGINATYKWFDLTANFNYVVGNDVYNLDKMVTSQSYRNTYASLRQEMTPVTLGGKAWTYMDQATGEIITDYETLKNMNANASIWSAATLSDNNPVPTSWAVEDGSFLRLQNLTVGFTFPKMWTKKFACNSLRLYCTLTNVFCLTSYSGYDPEVNSSIRGSKTSGLTPGADFSSYPKSFSWTVGANISF